ncbi:flagellar brake protein [Acidaminobacter sp. JC074]|uniref:flagellar brake protein n=1 Tax=Acidaminobacter sp. JC074 TaxID=2530199 RepID=UPI001F100CF6|nr:PilZ domain-containing protein [Acidaminobacter sp. JC074]MCH4888742.1 flagellar brake protein [Acidaminobacter sp. JC074]
MDLTVINVMRPGDNLEMHYINSLNQDLILETLIYDVVSDDEILIHNPLHSGKLYMIPMNIEVTTFAKRAEFGVVYFKMQLLKREKIGNVFTIRCRITSKLEKQQRRHFFRVRMFKDMSVYCMVDTFGHPVDYYIFDPDAVEEQQVNFKVDILDLSGGGVGLRSRFEVPVGTYIYGELPILNNPIRVTGIVVRCQESSKNIGEFDLGVKFVDLESEHVRAITSYVFKSQQQARRRELD